MNFEEHIYNKKETIGKTLFLISILFLISMFIVSLNGVFIFIDELYTQYLIQLPLDDAIKVLLSDIHPPLYFIVLKIPSVILSAWNINYNTTIVTRFTAIIPYITILLISGTKLKKDYNWFVAGLFAFTIVTMSEFYIQFITMRMYNWGLLFLILSFIYLKDVIENSDAKSWILLTLFTILGCYTHYILIVSLVILYLLLLAHFFINKNKTGIKKWFLSTISIILSFTPWMFIFLSQVADEGSRRAASSTTLKEMVNAFTHYAIKNTHFTFTGIVLMIIVLILLLYIMRWILARYLTNPDNCNSYMLIGILIPTLTIIGSIVAFSFMYKSLEIRYLIPVYSIFWLTISIYMGVLNKKRVFTILLITILLISCINTIDIANSVNKDISMGYEEQNLLNEINNPDSIIVYTHRYSYVCYDYQLDNTEGYATKYVKEFPLGYDLTSTNLTVGDINTLAKKNPNKHVYRIGPLTKEAQKKIDKNDILFRRGNWMIIQVS